MMGSKAFYISGYEDIFFILGFVFFGWDYVILVLLCQVLDCFKILRGVSELCCYGIFLKIMKVKYKT